MFNAEKWIKKLNLKPHPEGGYFREVYRSDDIISSEYLDNRYNGERNTATSILYLLKGDEFSTFHRLKSDETWHFNYGSTLEIHIISPEGKYSTVKLGLNIFEGEVIQYTIPAGSWFAAQPVNYISFTLAGCMVAPGFDYNDYEEANPQELKKEYPLFTDIIDRFTHK